MTSADDTEEADLTNTFHGKLRLDEVSTAKDEDELARFRREWEAEVKKSRGIDVQSNVLQHSGTTDLSEGASGSSSKRSNLSSRIRPVSSNEASKRQLEATLGAAHVSSTVDEEVEDEGETNLGDNALHEPIRLMRRAVLSYAQAVESERSGKLDVALTHYRRAFKLDSNADKLFERASNAIEAEVEHGGQGITGRRDVLIDTEEVRSSMFKALNVEDYRYRAMKDQEERSKKLEASKVTSTSATDSNEKYAGGKDELSALINRLSVHSGGERNFSEVRLEPEDEDQPIHIAKLPEEILLHILSFIAAPKGKRGARIGKPAADEQQQATTSGEAQEVAVREESHRKVVGIGMVLAGPDYMSIEQLGRTCWKFRLLTRAWSVWRLIVRETYFPPQIPSKLPLTSIVEAHANDWRTAFVEQPRVRLNGAYIAACHYTRAGMHEENVWVRVVHVVEFYRSLRFLPDGRTLSLLTTDTPSQTIRKMEPSLRGVKGFAIGTWTLHPQGLADDEVYSRPVGPKIVVDDLRDKTMSRYTFRIILKLDKTSRGKWNKMDILEYDSINLESGEICSLPLNHKKPFHFSTVRSYGI